MRFRLSSRRAESWARMSVEMVAGAEVWAARRRAARILREMLIRKESGVRSQNSGARENLSKGRRDEAWNAERARQPYLT